MRVEYKLGLHSKPTEVTMRSDESSSREPPTTQQIDAILQFLPVFQREDFSVGEWHGGNHADGVVTPPYLRSSDAMSEFHRALYDHNWVVSFDWPSWQVEARRLHEAADALKKADLETIRKLLTTHIRKERFCEGHLLAVYESGHLAAILERLAVIRSTIAHASNGRHH